MKKFSIKGYLLLILSVALLSFCLSAELLSKNYFTIVGETDDSSPENLVVEFLNVGMGDCTFIQFGDTQILVDSGEFEGNSEQGIMNSDKIIQHIKNSFSEDDKILDYVIVTHGDSDHLGNMSKILEEFNSNKYSVGNIIDFDSLFYEAFYQAKYHLEDYEKNKEFFDSKCNITSVDLSDNTGQVEESYHSDKLSNYKKTRDKLVKAGTKYYCVAERINDSVNYTKIFDSPTDESNVMSNNSLFQLDDGGSASLRVLYNKNYFDLLNSELMEKEIQGKYSDYAYYVNSKSVCLLLQFGKSKVLLTGDLEETHEMLGETNLVDTYDNIDENLLSDITLYKAAHHGSSTSNSVYLIKKTRPKYIAISAIANSKDPSAGGYWNFPRQDVLETFLSVTENVYITAYYNDGSGINYSYYGSLKFIMDDCENVETYATADMESEYNNVYTENGLKKLTETDWFVENRYLPFNIYVFDGYDSEHNVYLGNCSLIKYGIYDILIDCGVYGTIGNMAINSTCFIDKISEHCWDGKLEYVIVSSPLSDSIQQMVDIMEFDEVKEKGILSLYKVDNLIDFGDANDPSDGAERSLYKLYIEKRAELKNNGCNYKKASDVANKPFQITKELSLNILNNPYYNNRGDDQFEAVVCCNIKFCGKKMLFLGDLSDKGEKAIVENNDLSNTIFFKAVDDGFAGANSKELLNAIKNKKDRLYIAISSVARENISAKKILTKAVCDRIINTSQFCYVTMELDNKGKYKEICGDITFSIKSKNGKIEGDPSLVGSSGLQRLQDTQYYKDL